MGFFRHKVIAEYIFLLMSETGKKSNFFSLFLSQKKAMAPNPFLQVKWTVPYIQDRGTGAKLFGEFKKACVLPLNEKSLIKNILGKRSNQFTCSNFFFIRRFEGHHNLLVVPTCILAK